MGAKDGGKCWGGHEPGDVSAIAKILCVLVAPATASYVVPTNLQAKPQLFIKEEIHELISQWIRETTHNVCKPAERRAPALKSLLIR